MARKTTTRSAATDGAERDYAAIAARYAADVIEGRVVAGKWVRLACQRHRDDLKKRGWGFYFDEWHAADVCDFAEKLPHIEGQWGSPTVTLEPWQVFCLAVIFGWRRRADGGRRFSKVYFELARKNGKSTLAAIVSLYCFCCEQEPAPYVFIGATTGAQALKVFHPARMMARKTPALREAFGLQVWSKSITEPGGGYIQTVNAKGSTQDGHNPHLGVLDELHAHKDRALYDVIDSAFGARSNPLLWIITTAGFDVNGVCYEQRVFVTKVLEGILEADHYFGVIYTPDEDDVDAARKGEFRSAAFEKANPNLGVSVRVDQLEAAAKEARAQPGKLAEFLTKRLNVWTATASGHIDVPQWRRCKAPVDLEDLRGVPCWGGLDLASVSDLTSFRLVWWVGGRLKTWGTRYLPEAAVQSRTDRNSVPYARWARQTFMGRPLLTITEGNVTDYRKVEEDIRWALATFSLRAIGYDPWNAQDLVNRLTEDGAPMIEVRQGFPSLTGPMKELDRVYTGGLFDHGGDEVLAWCASNVVARRDDADNIKPSKTKSAEKIDDYSALLNAIAVSLADDAVPYSDGRPLIVL
jgi:phage terminase large subunit-like protein